MTSRIGAGLAPAADDPEHGDEGAAEGLKVLRRHVSEEGHSTDGVCPQRPPGHPQPPGRDWPVLWDTLLLLTESLRNVPPATLPSIFEPLGMQLKVFPRVLPTNPVPTAATKYLTESCRAALKIKYAVF